MPVTDRQAYTLIALKATTRGYHYHRRWLHGVFIGKLQHSMVKTAFVRAVFQVVDAVVPMEEVVGVGLGHKVWIRVFQNILMLLV